MDEYASCFDSIDPLAQYKNWRVDSQKTSSKTSISSQRVKAAFIVSDPIDWGRDIQVSITFFAPYFFNIYYSNFTIDARQQFSLKHLHANVFESIEI